MVLGVVAADPATRYALRVALDTLGFCYRVTDAPGPERMLIVCTAARDEVNELQTPGRGVLWVNPTRVARLVDVGPMRVPGRGYRIETSTHDLNLITETLGSVPDAPGDEFAVLHAIQDLGHHLLELRAAVGAELVRKAEWPDPHTWALALSHDVDWLRRWRLRSLRRALPERRLGEALGALLGIRPDPWYNIDQIRRCEDDRGLRSTFFFLADRSRYRLPVKAIRQLVDDGWEVELHANSFPDPQRLAQEQATLAHAANRKVRGNRYHYLRFEAPRAWQQLVDAGFTWDSSVGFDNRFGLRTGLPFPYPVFDRTSGRGLHLVELPIAVMDTALTWVPSAATALDTLAARVRSVRGCLVLLWHHRSFAERDFPGWRAHYESLLDRDPGAWRAPCGAVVDWWRTRSAVELTPLSANQARLAHLTARPLALRYYGPAAHCTGPAVTVLDREPDGLRLRVAGPPGSATELRFH